MQDTTLSFQTPIRSTDGRTLITHMAVPKGSIVVADVAASNIMETLWGDDAREWKPERWLSPLPQTVLEARIPGLYSNTQVTLILLLMHSAHTDLLSMSFGGGPRSCIGFRFSQLEMSKFNEHDFSTSIILIAGDLNRDCACHIIGGSSFRAH